MASRILKSHLCISFLFVIFFITQSKLILYTSDHEALSAIWRGLSDGGSLERNPCESKGIFCEKRVINKSHVLRITRLVFESQHFKGQLSPAIGRLSELKELSLPNNGIFGRIPPQLSECRKLEVFNLGNNRFSGQVPPALSSLIRLRLLDLSSNRLAGNLRFLKYFSELETLNLSDNMFAVELPVSLRSFRNLRIINTSRMSALENFEDHVADISKELVERESIRIPKRYVFAENGQNQTRSAVPPSSTASPRKHKNNRRKILGWALGFLAGIIAGSASGLLFSVFYKMIVFLIKGRRQDTSMKIFSPIIKNPEDLAFLQKEDGLASLEIIGKGGCGEVYKAVLPGSNGKEIAIKKIIQLQGDAEELTEEDSRLLDKKMRQLRSEILTVGQIRHKNLLPLLAHMPRPDCHYLVFEYMKNGSLHDYLQHAAEGKKQLDWLARYKIATGVALGLEYLHMNHTSRIIHRDLKPANILLDDDMEARIADFGLAKAVPDAHTHVTTSNIAGTVGYIAPEYYQTFKFTEKCDIYSFGVLLGGLVMGKLPSDAFFQHTEEVGLVKWMRNVMSSEEPHRAIDPILLGNGYEEQMLLVLKVACFCTLDNPKERPNSKDARSMLSQISH